MLNPIVKLSGTIILLAGMAACGSSVTEAATTEEDQSGNQADLSTDIQRASYMLGYDQTQQMADQTGGTIDLQAYLAGVQDQVGGNDRAVPMEEMEQIMTALRDAVMAEQAKAQAMLLQKGTDYRTEFAAKSGVTALPSGLLYEVIASGDGASPGLEDTVTTHYHGTLIDGTVFDSSVDRGQPASFPVNGVIKGWTEALQLMSVGDKWRLVVPPELAYGERGAGGAIGPNETLVFEVELLEIQAPESESSSDS